jgi:hypothetical protein
MDGIHPTREHMNVSMDRIHTSRERMHVSMDRIHASRERVHGTPRDTRTYAGRVHAFIGLCVRAGSAQPRVADAPAAAARVSTSFPSGRISRVVAQCRHRATPAHRRNR